MTVEKAKPSLGLTLGPTVEPETTIRQPAPRQDVTPFNRRLISFVDKRRYHEALALEQQIRLAGIIFDGYTYTTLINLYAKLSNANGKDYTKVIEQLWHEMRSRKLEPNVTTYTARIDGFSRVGNYERASDIFEEMMGNGISPTDRTYGTMMKMWLRAGEPRRAIDVYEQMIVPPNKIIYNMVIDALVKLGRYPEGQRLYELWLMPRPLKDLLAASLPREQSAGGCSRRVTPKGRHDSRRAKYVLDVHTLSHGSALMAVYSKLSDIVPPNQYCANDQATKLEVITGRGLHAKSGQKYEMRNFILERMKCMKESFRCEIHLHNEGMLVITKRISPYSRAGSCPKYPRSRWSYRTTEPQVSSSHRALTGPLASEPQQRWMHPRTSTFHNPAH